MRHHGVGAFVITTLALLVMLGAARQGAAQDANAPYPKMAPIDEYLMPDRGAEIALARSAAPESISRDATTLVLGLEGYETAVEGTNGFVCLVDRGWTGPFDCSSDSYAVVVGRTCRCWRLPRCNRHGMPVDLSRDMNSLGDVTQLIAAVNSARGWGDGARRSVSPSVSDAEERLDSLFAVSRTLAVYGTLAPGRPNHHVVAPLGGEWTTGIVEGDLLAEGWGAPLGYPAFNPRIGGAAVPVHVLTSPALPSAFTGLDEFEGPEYRRILIPVFQPGSGGERRLYTVANIYAAAEPYDSTH